MLLRTKLTMTMTDRCLDKSGVIVQVEVGLMKIHSVTRIFVAEDVSFLSWAES